MINNKQITISTANSRESVYWKAEILLWSEFIARLQTPARSTETLNEYLALPKSQQDNLKDVGGYVAGSLRNGRRKPAYVLARDVITLDLDNIPAGQTQAVLGRIDALGCGYAVYSTRKHSPANPRLRVLLPLARPATGDEYEPIARKLAQIIGIELCDPATFQVHRLMYWPSCCADSEYIFTYADKPFIDTDRILALYRNWHDISEWPGAIKQHIPTTRQKDPLEKTGIVGAFCKIYNVYQAIEKFIPDRYIQCDDNRFTYAYGSTTGGAIVYDNATFLYSHHATDPAGGKLVNSFDLVRLHLFGDKDDEAKPNTPTNRLPSYAAMCELAIQDPAVSSLLTQERYESAVEDFKAIVTVNDIEWMKKLKLSSTTGQPLKTTDNVLIILTCDPLLKDKLAYDEFANRGLVLGSLPWDSREERRQWTDIDDAGLRHYLERVYDITGKDRILDAVALCAHRNRINDVQNYLSSLSWDGIPRLDTLLIDYLGANDTPYTRAVIRKSLCAAVARAFKPGIKYDYMPILAGPQGIGKSTFLRILGLRWFSDSLQVFEGKEAAEMLQGVWINELGELNGLSRAETNAVKQFLSRTTDIYREPYGRRTQVFPRRCVFFGTTNDAEFLIDKTGNRRFWPVDVGINSPVKSVFNDLEYEVDQIWAEAVKTYYDGEELFMRNEIAKTAQEEQEKHLQVSTWTGIITEFVNRPIPADWDKRDVMARKLYWSNEFGRSEGETIPRYKICAAEIWVELMNGDLRTMRRADILEINSVLNSLPGWIKYKNAYRFGPYGMQRGYLRL